MNLLLMKLPVRIFCASAALINVYYIVAWIYAFNEMPTPVSRVGLFLDLFVFFPSVAAVDIFILIVTVGSIILINFFQSSREFYRISMTAVHVCFLGYLELTHL